MFPKHPSEIPQHRSELPEHHSKLSVCRLSEIKLRAIILVFTGAVLLALLYVLAFVFNQPTSVWPETAQDTYEACCISESSLGTIPTLASYACESHSDGPSPGLLCGPTDQPRWVSAIIAPLPIAVLRNGVVVLVVLAAIDVVCALVLFVRAALRARGRAASVAYAAPIAPIAPVATVPFERT